MVKKINKKSPWKQTHIQSLVGSLKGPGVGDGGIPSHDVSVRLFPFTAFPRLYHCGALPVDVL